MQFVFAYYSINMIYVNARFLTQPLTGVQRYAFEISMQMKKLNPSIVFLTPNNVIHQEWEKQLGATRMGFFKGHLWEQLELGWFITKTRQAILFSPSNTGPLFCKNQYLTLHDISFKLYPSLNHSYFSSFYNFLIPKLVKRIKGLFTVSETTQQEIHNHYHIPNDKIVVTYNGIGESMFDLASSDYRLHKEKMILSVGSLSKRKNTELLINAFIASNLSKEYKLIIIGNRNKIFAYEEATQASNVEFIEHATDELIIDYYQRAELACFLSVYEGFGIPVLESLYFGCKVLCSDIPVFRELYHGMVSFTSIQDTESVVNGLNQLPFSENRTSTQVNHLLEKYNYHKSALMILQTISES